VTHDFSALKGVLFGCIALLAGLFYALNALSSPRPVVRAVAPVVAKTYLPPALTFRLEDRFSTAPSEWRLAGAAVGEVTNRWQSDPRWTFMALENDARIGKPAILWSKRLFPGDVALDFFFGNKMDHLRGNPYSYARDVNVTIGSDGADLRKGYTFSFGGNGNTCSFVMRDGVEVKRVPVRIPTTMDYTRHWFHVHVERLSGTLHFRVDHFFATDSNRSGEICIEDSRPLEGDRVAIWTYDNAIMISRVSLSGEGGEMESPDFVAGPVKTIYDK
jgi:hypothetical protein